MTHKLLELFNQLSYVGGRSLVKKSGARLFLQQLLTPKDGELKHFGGKAMFLGTNHGYIDPSTG